MIQATDTAVIKHKAQPDHRRGGGGSRAAGPEGGREGPTDRLGMIAGAKKHNELMYQAGSALRDVP